MDKHRTNKEEEWSDWHGESGRGGAVGVYIFLNFSVIDRLKARAK